MKRNTSKFLIVLIALSLGLFGIIFLVFDPTGTFRNVLNIQNQRITDEDYAVYSHLINKLVIKENSSIEPINIYSQIPSESPWFVSPSFTLNDEYVQNLMDSYPKVDEDTLTNFATKQNPQIKLQPNFDLTIKYNLLDEKKVKENEGRGQKQVIGFSQVGFNKTKTQAFVRIECFCGISAFGSYVLLEKQNGDWQIKYEFNRWIT